jgi:lysyl endopeptidase
LTVGTLLESPPPLRLAETRPSALLAALPPAFEGAPDLIAEIARWNRAGRVPAKNGASRPLPRPARVHFGSVPGDADPEVGVARRMADGSVVWGAAVRVAGSFRLRLHLAEVNLPAEARLWVYGEEESRGPFGRELLAPAGDLWTPSVGGPVIRLEVRVPAGTRNAGFVVDRVLEVFSLDALGAPVAETPVGPPSCLVDAQCVGPATFDVIDLVQQGIAFLEFAVGGFGYYCTGGLLNNDLAPGDPLLLTANHCFSDQAAASTLEAYWDDYSAVCNGAAPALGSLPRSTGSMLLATAPLPSSDYTLVRLNDLPSNRVFLGWNASPGAMPNGTVVNRISHPLGLNQQYSRNHIDITTLTCTPAFRPTFLYETFQPALGDMGGTFGGSSGAPELIAGGFVVGQLLGGCGFIPDGCDYTNSEVDGAFSASYGALFPYLLSAIFTDGFETGDTSAWSSATP